MHIDRHLWIMNWHCFLYACLYSLYDISTWSTKWFLVSQHFEKNFSFGRTLQLQKLDISIKPGLKLTHQRSKADALCRIPEVIGCLIQQATQNTLRSDQMIAIISCLLCKRHLQAFQPWFNISPGLKLINYRNWPRGLREVRIFQLLVPYSIPGKSSASSSAHSACAWGGCMFYVIASY